MFEKNDLEFTSSVENDMRKSVAKTYLWMAMGVVVTGIVAVLLAGNTQFFWLIYGNSMIRMVLLVAQLGVVVGLAARLFKMKVTTARMLFIAYAVLLGVTLSSWLVVTPYETVLLAFGLSSVYFFALAVIGFTTKVNLLRFGPLLYTGLFAFVIVELIMMLMGMDITTMGFAAVGLLLFTGITAYDTQKLKHMLREVQGDADMTKRISIYCAFQLYLDFINIFLYILRILGNKD